MLIVLQLAGDWVALVKGHKGGTMTFTEEPMSHKTNSISLASHQLGEG